MCMITDYADNANAEFYCKDGGSSIASTSDSIAECISSANRGILLPKFRLARFQVAF